MGKCSMMASAIFIDLRLINIMLGAVLLVFTFFIPNLAGSFAFKQSVPLTVRVTNNISTQIWGNFWNPEFSYPLKEESISKLTLVLLCVPIPMVLILFSTMISFCIAQCGDSKTALAENIEPNHAESLVCTKWSLFRIGVRVMDGFSGLVESVGFTLFVTLVLKLAVGQPRPNYKELLKEDPLDATSSFPSGHASIAFCTFTYASLSLWIGVAAPLIKERKMHVLALPLLLVCTAPMCVASWIAVTRVQNYVHRCVDILAGAVIGLSSSVMFFRIHDSVPKPSFIVPPEPVKEVEKEPKKVLITMSQP